MRDTVRSNKGGLVVLDGPLTQAAVGVCGRLHAGTNTGPTIFTQASFSARRQASDSVPTTSESFSSRRDDLLLLFCDIDIFKMCVFISQIVK